MVVLNVATLSASAESVTSSPYCNWQCTCGGPFETITIDGQNGLPVELLAFGAEEAVRHLNNLTWGG